MNRQSKLKVADLGGEYLNYSIVRIFFAFVFLVILAPTLVDAQAEPLAVERMNELGPENSRMSQRVGTWDVVETVWLSPDAKPTSNKFVAERKMIGQVFQETIQPVPGAAMPDFRRMYWLNFNRVEGRWKYVSLDTRNPVGLMSAASFSPGENGSLTLTFEPFALAGPGTDVAGQMLRMDELITIKDIDHDSGEERFMVSNGSGKMWTAYKYEYVRRLGQSK